MRTKIVFGLLMAMAMIGNVEASDTKNENIEICERMDENPPEEMFRIYWMLGVDPYLYLGTYKLMANA